MLKIMRADLQRIFRGKGIYITLGLFLLVVVLSIYEGFYMGVNMSNEELGFESLMSAETGAKAAFFMMSSADNIFYFMLPVIIFIASTDFSTGTVKNVLSSGTSRLSFYLSKLILTGLFGLVMYSLYIILPMIIATIQNGFGGTLDMNFVISVLKPFLIQFLLILTIISVGMFLVFMTKRTAAVNGAYIAFLLVPTMLILMLATIQEKFFDLLNYDLAMNMKRLAYFTELTTGDITRIILIGIGYILVSTMGGMLLFNRSEIK